MVPVTQVLLPASQEHREDQNMIVMKVFWKQENAIEIIGTDYYYLFFLRNLFEWLIMRQQHNPPQQDWALFNQRFTGMAAHQNHHHAL